MTTFVMQVDAPPLLNYTPSKFSETKPLKTFSDYSMSDFDVKRKTDPQRRNSFHNLSNMSVGRSASILDEIKDTARNSIASLKHDLAMCLENLDPPRREALELHAYVEGMTQWESVLCRVPKILESSPFAEIGTPLGSTVGVGSKRIPEADVLYLSPAEFERRCQRDEVISKPTVIKGPKPEKSSESVIQEFLTRLQDRYPNSDIDFQNLSLRLGELSNEGKARKNVTGLFNSQQTGGLSNENPPTNVLNIRDVVEEPQPKFLQERRFQILPTIHSRLESKQIADGVSAAFMEAYPWITPKQLGPRVPTPAGKQAAHFNLDLSACQRFNLFAQRGSYTGWHVDILNGTYVHTLAGMKLWLIVPNITAEELQQFSIWGPLWTPPPGRARMILLTPGTTLVMPPGVLVVHSVITLEDTLMTGGMFWDSLAMIEVLRNIAWIASESTVTNEPVPRQLPATIDILESIIRLDPRRFIPPVDDDQDELAEPRRMTSGEYLTAFAEAKELLRRSITCACAGKCVTACKKRQCRGKSTCEHVCKCRRSMAQEGICTTWCHDTVPTLSPCQETGLERAWRDGEKRRLDTPSPTPKGRKVMKRGDLSGRGRGRGRGRKKLREE